MSWLDHDMTESVASGAEMAGSEFAATLPNPYDVFGVPQAVETKRVIPRPMLSCSHEECDFETHDGLEWQLHQMDTGHALDGES